MKHCLAVSLFLFVSLAAFGADSLMKKQHDTAILEALNAPEPKRPEMPARLAGNIGLEDGKEKVVRGQLFITTRDGTNYKLGVVIVRVVGSREWT